MRSDLTATRFTRNGGWSLLIASVVLCIGATLVTAEDRLSAAERPNFVFILADDLGSSDLGCYESSIYESPDDLELSFCGPARQEVVDAWRSRFNRMTLLRDFCVSDFEQVRDEFVDCLTRADHQSHAKVCFCLGKK